MSDSVTKYFENADSTAPLNKLDMKARVTRKQKTLAQMEERMLWYESELNLNPFSWGKKR